MSIGDVAEICGVAVVTVRSWERRYGWPEPVRSSGDHRRYLARDEDAFVQLAELRRSMSTRHAIDALRESQRRRAQPPADPRNQPVVQGMGAATNETLSLTAG